jgi:adenylate cyclase
MSPGDVVSMLNEYFSAAADIIFENNGVLDKFIGDEIMATFGVLPSGKENHPFNAVKTAVEMQKRIETLTKSSNLFSRDNFKVGIGINTGNAIVGNVGSTNRMDYTAIGESVNTASRLQVIAEGGEIIIGPETYEQVKDKFEIEKKGQVKLKNMKTPVHCYRVNYM